MNIEIPLNVIGQTDTQSEFQGSTSIHRIICHLTYSEKDKTNQNKKPKWVNSGALFPSNTWFSAVCK